MAVLVVARVVEVEGSYGGHGLVMLVAWWWSSSGDEIVEVERWSRCGSGELVGVRRWSGWGGGEHESIDIKCKGIFGGNP